MPKIYTGARYDPTVGGTIRSMVVTVGQSLIHFISTTRMYAAFVNRLVAQAPSLAAGIDLRDFALNSSAATNVNDDVAQANHWWNTDTNMPGPCMVALTAFVATFGSGFNPIGAWYWDQGSTDGLAIGGERGDGDRIATSEARNHELSSLRTIVRQACTLGA